MDVQKVLGTREVFWFSKKQFEVNPMWDDDSELANWKLYHIAHYTYALHREAFLEYRRATRRTVTALAAAEAEIARLRAVMKDAGAIAHAYGELTGDGFDADAFRSISDAINAALEPQEATDGNG